MKERKYYLWVDTETAGLIYDDFGKELPGELMEVSAILTDDTLNPIFTKDWTCKWKNTMSNSITDEIYDLHSKNGLVNSSKQSNITPKIVDIELHQLITMNTYGNAKIILAGNSVAFDKEVIRRNLPRVFNLLYYRILDVSSIKELLLMVDPSIVYRAQGKKEYNHRALPDIKESIEEFRDYWIIFADVISSYK